MDMKHIESLGGLHLPDPRLGAASVTTRPITKRDLRALEAKLGQKLPDDYVAFLLQYNSGAVRFGKPVRFPFPDKKYSGWVSLDAFFTLLLGKRAPGYDLWTNYQVHQGIIPSYLLPIIGNAAGSYVCLAISGPTRGSVFFWEHELVDYSSDEPTDEGVFLIAPSFDEFLRVLQVEQSG
jgi:hypothetical protein